MALSRSFRFGGDQQIQLRAGAFNVLNTVTPGNPSIILGRSDLGGCLRWGWHDAASESAWREISVLNGPHYAYATIFRPKYSVDGPYASSA
jgi:hypothetical protein